jgi:hypothetical protein
VSRDTEQSSEEEDTDKRSRILDKIEEAMRQQGVKNPALAEKQRRLIEKLRGGTFFEQPED